MQASFDASVFQGRSQELLLVVHKSEMRGLGATLGPQRVKAPRELSGFNYLKTVCINKICKI